MSEFSAHPPCPPVPDAPRARRLGLHTPVHQHGLAGVPSTAHDLQSAHGGRAVRPTAGAGEPYSVDGTDGSAHPFLRPLLWGGN